MKKLALAAAAVLTLILPASVLAHEVSITVQCPNSPGGGILVHGILFTGNPAGSEPLLSPVTLTGPDGYVEVFVVPSAEWAHTFPLGPNGSYHIDWPNAGQFAQDFTVECAAVPTPTPERTPPTTGGFPPPTPHLTPPPTDEASEAVQARQSATFAIAIALVLVVIGTLVALNRRRGR